jgi:hypothetical protein
LNLLRADGILRARRGAPLALAALLALGGSLPASAQFGKNKIQYREFDWKIYHSPHFDLHYYTAEEGQLEKMASLAESAYDRLTREFDHQIQDPVPLIFYLTHSAFEQNNIILNFIPEGVGAFASPVRNRMVLPIDLEDGELYALVLHELTHIFQYDILYRGRLSRSIAGNAPQWFMEGMASYMAKDETTQDQMFLRDAVVNDSIPSILERGAPPSTTSRSAGARKGSATSSTSTATPSAAAPIAPSSAPSTSTRRTSTSTSAAGSGRSTCPAWSRPASRRTSAGRSATTRGTSSR